MPHTAAISGTGHTKRPQRPFNMLIYLERGATNNVHIRAERSRMRMEDTMPAPQMALRGQTSWNRERLSLVPSPTWTCFSSGSTGAGCCPLAQEHSSSNFQWCRRHAQLPLGGRCYVGCHMPPCHCCAYKRTNSCCNIALKCHSLK